MAKQIVVSLTVPDGATPVLLQDSGVDHSSAGARRTVVTNLLALYACDVVSTRQVGFTSNGAPGPGGTGETFPLPSA